jgi:hypothetical protein
MASKVCYEKSFTFLSDDVQQEAAIFSILWRYNEIGGSM